MAERNIKEYQSRLARLARVDELIERAKKGVKKVGSIKICVGNTLYVTQRSNRRQRVFFKFCQVPKFWAE